MPTMWRVCDLVTVKRQGRGPDTQRVTEEYD